MPNSQYFVEIRKKEGLPDGRSAALMDSVCDLGIDSVDDFQVGNLYILTGRLPEDSLDEVCRRLFCDPVAETAQVGTDRLSNFDGTLTIQVTYHPGVTDAVAGTVIEALELLGISGVEQVATGMLYHLYSGSDLPDDAVQIICERVLANPVIQHFQVFDATGNQMMKR